jgi:hypothetical protein
VASDQLLSASMRKNRQLREALAMHVEAKKMVEHRDEHIDAGAGQGVLTVLGAGRRRKRSG